MTTDQTRYILDWSDICAGLDCGKKAQCRRHTYWLLYEARDGDTIGPDVRANVYDQICNTRAASFIDNDSDLWSTKPGWWNR